jgi:dTDP-4-amino-4,6-dideoxygalactose transaminase
VIPLVDLSIQHQRIADEVEPALAAAMARGAFIGGDDVAAFEAEFAAFCQAAHCIGVANGTDAIELALRALDVGAGDAVVLPANTFIASAEAVVRVGAQPVLVDCDDHFLIDVEQAIDAIAQSSAKVVIPVDLYGQLAAAEALTEASDRYGCAIVEDAAQSQGATRHGEPVGRHAVAASTSFYPGKNLGAYGDAGAVVTDDGALARRVRLLANHGSEARYVHDEMGFNSRLDNIQAIVLRAKLRRLAGWNEERSLAAARYDELLAGLDVVTPTTAPGNAHVWHLYVVRVPRRDDVLARMNAAGVGAAVHYPIPVHLHGAARALGHKAGDFPRAEAAAAEILSLPIYPGITAAQQATVVDALAAALA